MVPGILLQTDNLVSSCALTIAFAYSNLGLVCLLSWHKLCFHLRIFLKVRPCTGWRRIDQLLALAFTKPFDKLSHYLGQWILVKSFVQLLFASWTACRLVQSCLWLCTYVIRPAQRHPFTLSARNTLQEDIMSRHKRTHVTVQASTCQVQENTEVCLLLCRLKVPLSDGRVQTEQCIVSACFRSEIGKCNPEGRGTVWGQ